MKKIINLALILSVIAPSQAITVFGYKYGFDTHAKYIVNNPTKITKINPKMLLVQKTAPWLLYLYLGLIFAGSTVYSLTSLWFLIKVLTNKIELI